MRNGRATTAPWARPHLLTSPSLTHSYPPRSSTHELALSRTHRLPDRSASHHLSNKIVSRAIPPFASAAVSCRVSAASHDRTFRRMAAAGKDMIPSTAFYLSPFPTHWNLLPRSDFRFSDLTPPGTDGLRIRTAPAGVSAGSVFVSSFRSARGCETPVRHCSRETPVPALLSRNSRFAIDRRACRTGHR